MKKHNVKIVLILIGMIFLITGCGKEETCIKWKTVTTGGKDCSKIDAGNKPNEYQYCKMFQEKQTETKECVKWK